jgi:hypothetical protein
MHEQTYRPPLGRRIELPSPCGGSDYPTNRTPSSTNPTAETPTVTRAMALLVAPAELLRAVAAIYERGWGIALDDVGAVPDSLALLSFIAPRPSSSWT